MNVSKKTLTVSQTQRVPYGSISGMDGTLVVESIGDESIPKDAAHTQEVGGY